MNIDFIKQGEMLAAEMEKIHLSGLEPEKAEIKFQHYSNIILKRMISESRNEELDLDDVIAAIRIIDRIPDITGSPYTLNTDTIVNDAVLSILTPSRVLNELQKKGTSLDAEIMLNGVKLTLSDAIKIYQCLENLSEEIAFGYKNHMRIKVSEDYFEEMGFNPFKLGK